MLCGLCAKGNFMPTDKIYPLDKLSNPIKPGDLVFLRNEEVDPLFAVLEVEPASVLHTPEGDMPITGKVKFGLFFEVPFSPERPQFVKAIVVKTPEEKPRLQ
jgi:hypothetical protein